MKYFLSLLSNPLVGIILVPVVALIFIAQYHNHAHYTMDKDADGYVFRWCKKNPDICTHRGNGY
jgi:hypothetical protein